MIKALYLFLLVQLFQITTARAQQFSLTISSTNSEKGRDSHSTTEFIKIEDKAASYSVKYSGRKGPNQKDEEKKCTLTTAQVNKIKALMKERHLDVTDSLIDNSLASESYATTASITITEKKGTGLMKIKVKGLTKEIGNKPLYKNSHYLVSFVSDMIKNCDGK